MSSRILARPAPSPFWPSDPLDEFLSLPLSLPTNRLIPPLDRVLATALPLDVISRDKEYTVKAELPGMAKEDIRVTCESGVLTIAGEKKRTFGEDDPLTRVHREESHYGFLSRSVRLPMDADMGAVQATYKDGILEIAIKKLESEKIAGKQIAIN